MKIYIYVVLLCVNVLLACSDSTLILEESEVAEETEQQESLVESSFVADRIYVHISGEVLNPAVYEFDVGARVYEAIEQAGGFTEIADRNYLNLAKELVDGEQIYVPAIGEAESMSAADNDIRDAKVNINTATKEELLSLKGIGEGRADDIIAYRDKNGAFSSIEDIMKVPGIKQASFDKIKDDISIK